MFVVTPAGLILRWNLGAERLFGYPEARSSAGTSGPLLRAGGGDFYLNGLYETADSGVAMKQIRYRRGTSTV
jgi:hypothetical protein